MRRLISLIEKLEIKVGPPPVRNESNRRAGSGGRSDFDANGRETSISQGELVTVFVRGGFRGYISNEWGGRLHSRSPVASQCKNTVLSAAAF